MAKTKKNPSARKKLLSAVAMLTVSAVTLSTATYAWFTMNKEVSVNGMKLQAQAEKGILINEKAGVSEGTWSETATAGQATAYALKPTSTYDFGDWWHANSRKTNLEAGIGSGTTVEATNTVDLGSGTYYANLSTANVHTVDAVNDGNCQIDVYYTDGVGSGASSGTLDAGEGYYIKYTYYIKTSGNEALNVTAGNLKAAVKATRTAGEGSGTHSNEALDGALRVGIKVDGDSKATIFAPVTTADETNKVTKDVNGSDAYTVTPVRASATGTATAATSINTAAVSLPAVTAPGKPVYVYVWYEGEDTHCKSDNLAQILDNYEIDITFTDADLG
jgi:hypothetical protein